METFFLAFSLITGILVVGDIEDKQPRDITVNPLQPVIEEPVVLPDSPASKLDDVELENAPLGDIRVTIKNRDKLDAPVPKKAKIYYCEETAAGVKHCSSTPRR